MTGEHDELVGLKKKLRLTHLGVAERLDVSESQWKNWYYMKATIPDKMLKKVRAMALVDAAPEVGKPEGPFSESEVEVPYIGLVAASSPKDWTDPLDTGLERAIPVHMLMRGVFTCEIAGDSMSPLLEPGDTAIFQVAEFVRAGRVVLYYHPKTQRVTVKQLKHDGHMPVLHPLNPTYSDEPANGNVIGVLIGYDRKVGKRRVTAFDPDGITPGV